jgi:hydroxyacylglutathione hydrolase
MKLQVLTANPFQVNTYLVSNEKNETIIIDPACGDQHEQDYFVEEIRRLNLKPLMILLTHGHIDHILGCGFMSTYYNIDVYAHPKTEFFIGRAEESATAFGIPLTHAPEITKHLEHGQLIGIDGISLSVLYTPGHATGSVCYYSEQEKVLFSGDVLFMQSIGRTDLPTGDMDTLLESISNNLLVLPPETIVYPGHGPETTIADEIRYNPFLADRQN